MRWAGFAMSQSANYQFAAASGGGAEPVHRPVLLAETLDFLAVAAGGIYIDGTLGEGGHTEGILEASDPSGAVLGIDRDPRSVAVARHRLSRFGERVVLVHGNYADMGRIADEHGISGVDGVLLDLGFSSRQVNTAGYGFSFQTDEPLDMRYDPTGETAADMVNGTAEAELADVIFQFGEERRSRAIARAIVRNRPINTTDQLAQGGGAGPGRPQGRATSSDAHLPGVADRSERGADARGGGTGSGRRSAEVGRTVGGDQLPQPGGPAGQRMD